MRRSLDLVSGVTTWGVVAVPDPIFSWTPFTVVQLGNLFGTAGWDVSKNAPTGKTYYVREDGNDLNSGLTEALALRAVKTAAAKSDAVVIMVKAGTYTWGYGMDGTTPNRNLSIIGYGGEVVLSTHIAGLSWAKDGNHYEANYATAIEGCWDKLYPDSNDNYLLLTKQISEALVDANPNSWYWAANVLYVRTTNDRVPDANILPMVQGHNVYLHVAKTMYLENLTVYGGDSSIYFAFATPGAKMYAKNCTAKYCTSANSFDVTGGDEAIFQGCTATAAYLDGFKATENVGKYANLALINCVGRHNGQGTGSARNGYSRHDRGATIIIGGEYYGNRGRNIHDINSGVGNPSLWCLGVNSHNSDGGPLENVNFVMGTIPTFGGTAWLDCCVSTGSIADIEAATGATVYIRNFSGDAVNTGAGTIASY